MSTPTKHLRARIRLTRLCLTLSLPIAGVLGTGPFARAQDQQPAAPAAEAATPVADAPVAPTGDAQPAATERTVDDRLAEIEGKLEGMGESGAATTATVDKLAKIKVSGYVQGRYEWHDDADFGVDPARANAPRGTNRFFVRRGRVKTTYAGDLSEFVLQVDATGDGVALRDAEASFVLDNTNPWMPSDKIWELKLTMGQFKTPFGYEVLQSSSDREMPERTSMVRALFPGERDRGVRLSYRYGVLRLNTAVINGTGTSDAIYRTFDQTSWKDFVGRLGVDLKFLVVGVSGHFGRSLKTTLRPAMGMTPASAVYERYGRTRIGADAQLYFDVPHVGGLALKGEFMWAKDTQKDFSEVPPDANQCKDVSSLGWAGTVVQNIGSTFGVVLRLDQFDPNRGPPDACDQKARDTAAQDKVTSFGAGLLGYVSGNLKATVAYEHVAEHEAVKKDNDVVTVQLQAKF